MYIPGISIPPRTSNGVEAQMPGPWDYTLGNAVPSTPLTTRTASGVDGGTAAM